jgi:hypothetical protein
MSLILEQQTIKEALFHDFDGVKVLALGGGILFSKRRSNFKFNVKGYGIVIPYNDKDLFSFL